MKNSTELVNSDPLLTLFNESYNNYGREVFEDVFTSISDNIKAIYEVYQKFPSTCINFLEQLKLPFQELEYLQQVTNPIRFYSIKRRNPSLEQLAISLDALRAIINGNQQMFQVLYEANINRLDCENKTETFKKVAKEVCMAVIDITIHKLETDKIHGQARIERMEPSDNSYITLS
ncbi:hypothetical protein BN59_00657 [Legionella massiliensis]|uniref:Uncharacterized protein n=1 Tax=Legionella massiliensis TaxID=1034943 RepID=A0A078KXF9_9GAMM|nr:hypothetical protein [Legionella massiliensis]CDZ76388.1 hypothetical protein BN59_00657 [Legionella massiliensis]CEE12126.1 hypothetical protein BN1094_00657 [Legionella massiliensis]